MECVIVNDGGELYAGFEDGKPHWFKTKRADAIMDEKIAETVLRQLHLLGFDKTCIRPANGVIRKWVPAELDAAKC